MTELNEIINRYATLIEAMDKLEEEVPEIQKIHKELEKELKNRLEITEKAIESIKKQAKSSIGDINNASDKTEQLLAKLEKASGLASNDVKKLIELMSELDKKSKEVQALINQNNNFDSNDLEKRIAGLERKINLLEKNRAQSSNNDKILKSTSSNILPSYKSKFPHDAYRFSLENIQNVYGKKPYGIVIEGFVIEASYWTNMLEEAVSYTIQEYEVDCEDLIDTGYIKESYTGKEIPYFIQGSFREYEGQYYRPIKDCNISVYYGGSNDVVDLLYDLLIEYLEISPKNVEIFYHDK